MTFSIIIPVYNVAPYLRECLDSVLAQTYTDWEAICVDDGSTDGSGSILDEYGAKDSRFKVVHQENKGVSAARNAALDHATGKWLMFLDADDVYLQGALKKVSELVSRNAFDGCFFSDPVCFETGEEPLRVVDGDVARFSGSVTGADVFLSEPRIRSYSVGWLLSRRVFADIRFPLGVAMMEDAICLVSVLSHQARWIRTGLTIYGYRQVASSASHSVRADMPLEVVRSVQAVMKLAKQKLCMTTEQLRQAARLHYRQVLEHFLTLAFSDPNCYGCRNVALEMQALVRQIGCCPVRFCVRLKYMSYVLWGRPVGFPLITFLDRVLLKINRMTGREK